MQSDRKRLKADDAADLFIAAANTINNEANPADLSTMLPAEIVFKNIVPHLDTADMVNTKKVSCGWRNVFADDYAILTHWKQRFLQDFGFDKTLLCKALDTDILTGHDVRNLYKNYTLLLNTYHIEMPNYIQFMLEDQENAERLLICAGGNINALMQEMEEDLYPQWFNLACYTNLNELACSLYRTIAESADNIMDYLALADTVANTELVKDLIDLTKTLTGRSYMMSAPRAKTGPETAVEKCHPRYTSEILKQLNNGDIKPSQQLFDAALEAGNYHLACHLVSATDFTYAITQKQLNLSAKSGNFKLLEKMILECAALGVQPTRMTLNYAASSGSIPSVAMLAQNHNILVLGDTLQCALRSGSIPLVDYLCQIEPGTASSLNAPLIVIAANNSDNKSLSDYYIPCYQTLINMIVLTFAPDEHLADHISRELSIAYQQAPSFFPGIIQTILDQREDYELSEQTAEIIMNDPTYKAVAENDEDMQQAARHILG